MDNELNIRNRTGGAFRISVRVRIPTYLLRAHPLPHCTHLPAGQPLGEVYSGERRGCGRQEQGRVRHDVVQPRRPLRRLAVLILEHVEEDFFALVGGTELLREEQ